LMVRCIGALLCACVGGCGWLFQLFAGACGHYVAILLVGKVALRPHANHQKVRWQQLHREASVSALRRD
jgi:hypothetical protein